MPSTITPKKHNVVSAELEACIRAFFSYQDWKGLYLSGGTCIAEYYFGHRSSIDMDLFTQDRALFISAQRFLSSKKILGGGQLETVRTTADLCQFLLKFAGKDPVKIDLVMDIPVTLGEKIRVEDIWLDSLPDLVANKLGCLIQSEEVKDYIDLFYLIPAINLPIRELIHLGQKKDAGLDPVILAYQMQFIQKTHTAPSCLMANIPWKQIQYFFSSFHDHILDSL